MSGVLSGVLFVLAVVAAFAIAFKAREKGVLRSDDSVIGGVCGGIAAHFQIQPWLVRLLTVIALFGTGGVTLLFYLVLWGVLNENQSK